MKRSEINQIMRDGLGSINFNARNHNMLVPAPEGGGVRPRAGNPAPVAVIPEASDDAVAFTAELKPGILWPAHYAEREF